MEGLIIMTLLSILNNYSKEYAESGNTALLPAIGRIAERIENETGKKLKVVVEKNVAKYSL